MSVTDHADAAGARTGEVRLCEACGRPMAARDKSEYTAARARLILQKGLCVCPAQAPTRGPSLI
jgi:hypothetical protein